MYGFTDLNISFITYCTVSQTLKYNLLHFVRFHGPYNIINYILYDFTDLKIYFITYCTVSHTLKYNLLHIVRFHRPQNIIYIYITLYIDITKKSIGDNLDLFDKAKL